MTWRAGRSARGALTERIGPVVPNNEKTVLNDCSARGAQAEGRF